MEFTKAINYIGVTDTVYFNNGLFTWHAINFRSWLKEEIENTACRGRKFELRYIACI